MFRFSKPACFVALLAVFLVGCPVIRIAKVEIKPDSISETQLTLTVSIKVDETDDPVNEEGQQEGGRGLVGVWLPQGWNTIDARVKITGQDSLQSLEPIPGVASYFPVSFPYVPGAWWPFATACQYIPEGSLEYVVEVDIAIPEGTKNGIVGIIPTVYQENLNARNPTEVHLDLEAGTAVIEKPELPIAEPAENKSEEEPVECPVKQVRPGPRGCSCNAVGSGSSGPAGLLPLVLEAIWK